MMINSFDNYVKSGKAKPKTPDREEAKALLEKAIKRLSYAQEKDVTEDTAQFILEDSYEAAREAAQSLMSLQGFKPYSHEATISFIRDRHGESFTEEEIVLLDRFRQLRNDSMYKAVPVFPTDAKKCLVFSSAFIKKIRALEKR
jgi:uncharacterized protein (UPF0332 family)